MKYKEIYIWEQGLRDLNQDAVGLRILTFNNKNYVIGIVCDGIGGLQKGEVAATYLATHMLEMFFSFLEKERKTPGRSKIKTFLKKEIYCCHRELQIYAHREGIQLGSTLTMFFLKEQKGFWFHAGDSAVYIGKSRFGRLQKFNRKSKIHQNEKRQLVQAIGIGDYRKPQIKRVCLRKWDGILLCTDGFYRRLEVNKGIFRKSFGRIHKKEFEQMVEKVQQQGEGDNISMLCIVREE